MNKPFGQDVCDRMEAMLRESGREVTIYKNYSTDQKTPHPLPEMLANAEVAIVRSDILKEELNFPEASNLRLIIRAGAGVDNIDTRLAKTKGIAVQNTPGTNSNATGELAIALMLYVSRNQLKGVSSMGYELRGKKLGLYGFGNVARCVARIAKGFGMDVWTYDIAYPANFEEYGVNRAESLEQLFQGADYISVHVPGGASTNESVNYDLMSLMNPISFVINTARDTVVNEADVSRLMGERPLFHYATDVSQGKDVSGFDPKRFYVTPAKQGAQTEEANIQSGIQACTQALRYLRDGAIDFRVNP